MEPLGLATIDRHLKERKKKLIAQPDDPDDPGLKSALTKTLPHSVPIDDRFAHVLLHNFIVKQSYPGAKRNPHVFASGHDAPPPRLVRSLAQVMFLVAP